MSDKPVSTLAVCLRCAGLALIIYAVGLLPSWVLSLSYVEGSGLFLLAAPSISFLVIGAALMRFAPKIASALGGDDQGEAAPDLLLIGLQLIGIYWLIGGVGDLMYNFFQIRYEQMQTTQKQFTNLAAFPYAIANLVQLGIAIVLLLRSKRVANWLRFREA